MRLCLLGPPALVHANGTLVFAAERRFQLLALLAHRGEWVSRERLSALFWPDHPADAARRNLRKVLHRLHELGSEVFAETPVEEQGGALRWPVATDLAEFEQAAARGERAAALALWQGEPWQGIDGGSSSALAEWLQTERQRLTARWHDALLAAGRDTASPLEALRLAEQAMAQNPLDEEALQLLMQACLRLDRRAAALAAGLAFSERLAESLGLEPAARTRELMRVARDDGNGAAVATAAAPPSGSALRPTSTPAADFIGRQTELRELAALLDQPGGRWITLVGPGGIGKSRLMAAAVAERGDAACPVPLEDVRSVGGVALRVAAGLGVVLAGGADNDAEAWRQLAEAVGSDERLLALDNLEHLLSAVPALAGLLRSCPGLRILATSRERTGTAGEWLVPVSGMPYPEAEDADRAEAFDAIRLFVARARQADPRFALGSDRAGVVELCRWVEGMPLAIELAAVWIRHFRAAEIVRELKAGGEMLHQPGGERLAPRQRSMAATFEHSWQLLVPAERKVLAALSVFHGGFTRAAATAATGASLAVLTALIEKSLVRRDDGGARSDPAEVRYGLHPLVQELAAVKLDSEPGARGVAEAAHLDYFAGYLQRMPGAEHQAQRSAFRLAARAEIDNLFAAWRGAAAEGRITLLAEMATPLRLVVFASLRRAELLALFDAVREAVGRELPRFLAVLDLSRGILDYGLGRFVEAAEILMQAVKGLARGGDRRDQRTALIWLAQSQMMLGRLAPAHHGLERALASARADGDERAISDCIGNLGSIDFQLGRFASALLWMRESLVVRQAAGGELATLYNNLGLAQLYAGSAATAIETLERGLAASAVEPNPDVSALLHYNMAQARLALGDVDRAEASALASAAAIADGQAPAMAISTNSLLARILLRRGDSARARALLQSATREARARRIAPLELGVLFYWTEWLLLAGDLARARRLHAWVMAQEGLEPADRLFGDSLQARVQGDGGAPPAAPSKADAEAIVVELLALS